MSLSKRSYQEEENEEVEVRPKLKFSVVGERPKFDFSEHLRRNLDNYKLISDIFVKQTILSAKELSNELNQLRASTPSHCNFALVCVDPDTDKDLLLSLGKQTHEAQVEDITKARLLAVLHIKNWTSIKVTSSLIVGQTLPEGAPKSLIHLLGTGYQFQLETLKYLYQKDYSSDQEMVFKALGLNVVEDSKVYQEYEVEAFYAWGNYFLDYVQQFNIAIKNGTKRPGPFHEFAKTALDTKDFTKINSIRAMLRQWPVKLCDKPNLLAHFVKLCNATNYSGERVKVSVNAENWQKDLKSMWK